MLVLAAATLIPLRPGDQPEITAVRRDVTGPVEVVSEADARGVAPREALVQQSAEHSDVQGLPEVEPPHRPAPHGGCGDQLLADRGLERLPVDAEERAEALRREGR